jgi:hypothetical protein
VGILAVAGLTVAAVVLCLLEAKLRPSAFRLSGLHEADRQVARPYRRRAYLYQVLVVFLAGLAAFGLAAWPWTTLSAFLSGVVAEIGATVGFLAKHHRRGATRES